MASSQPSQPAEPDPQATPSFQEQYHADLLKVVDLAASGKFKEALVQCRENLQCRTLGRWWHVANLLLLVDVKQSWDGEAHHYFWVAKCHLLYYEEECKDAPDAEILGVLKAAYETLSRKRDETQGVAQDTSSDGESEIETDDNMSVEPDNEANDATSGDAGPENEANDNTSGDAGPENEANDNTSGDAGPENEADDEMDSSERDSETESEMDVETEREMDVETESEMDVEE